MEHVIRWLARIQPDSYRMVDCMGCWASIVYALFCQFHLWLCRHPVLISIYLAYMFPILKATHLKCDAPQWVEYYTYSSRREYAWRWLTSMPMIRQCCWAMTLTEMSPNLWELLADDAFACLDSVSCSFDEILMMHHQMSFGHCKMVRTLHSMHLTIHCCCRTAKMCFGIAMNEDFACDNFLVVAIHTNGSWTMIWLAANEPKSSPPTNRCWWKIYSRAFHGSVKTMLRRDNLMHYHVRHLRWGWATMQHVGHFRGARIGWTVHLFGEAHLRSLLMKWCCSVRRLTVCQLTNKDRVCCDSKQTRREKRAHLI